ncbi:unnamed protein product [Rotaria sordida]|uniref:RNA helicase n=1 Tax=Rotaria sordida TaxID=392033 RepID=A0A815HLM1_9BILA|nr:unnamed protein product [Rotaria sordida]CAF1355633.1 unnamed protein product [Rotaria sordida]
MISYSHSDRQLCYQIHERLVQDGFSVWIDRDNMYGTTMIAMAEAIENSEFILICMSDTYKQSVYCQSEAHYAFERRCHLIPLIMKHCYKPDGWLGHRSSSHRSNSERDKKRSRRSSSRDRHRRDGKSSKKHSKKSSKSHRTSRSRSPLRESSSTTDKERLEAEQKRLEEEMQKRKNRIEQWRAERRIMLGIDKVMQQSIAQSTKGKTWSLEDERDEDEEDLQNAVIPSIDLKRDVAAARETVMASQADKQREALERAAQAAALTSAACVNAERIDDEEEDPLDKFMEDIAKEVKSFRGTNTTIISTKSNENNSKAITRIKQEQLSNNTKGSVIKIITKTIKNESTVTSTNESNNGTVPTTNGHHNDSSIVKTKSMDTSDQSSSVPSRVTVRSGVAKRAKEKGLIIEQDIDGLEYSSEEESTKPNEDLDDIFAISVVPEIANIKEAEVATYREELDGIKVVGKRCPRPIKTWSQCITSDKILQCFKKYNYEKPIPIQAQPLPIILSSRNMIGITKTGSGKTLAFILPMFRHIKDQPPLEDDDGPIAIIMTPTRQLALQTTKECKKFPQLFNIRCVPVYDGTGISEQIVC